MIIVILVISFILSTYLAFKLNKLEDNIKDLNIKNNALKDYVGYLEETVALVESDKKKK